MSGTLEDLYKIPFQLRVAPTTHAAPLAGLWSRQSFGFYHDGRFQTLDDVINHYDQHMNLGLTKGEKKDLVEFLRSL